MNITWKGSSMEDNNNNKPGDDNSGGGMNKRAGIITVIATIVIFLVFIYGMNLIKQGVNREITYNEFVKMIDEGKVESVVLKQGKIEITPKSSANDIYTPTYYTGYIGDSDLANRLLKANVSVNSPVADATQGILEFFAIYILPLLGIWVVMYLIYRSFSKNAGGMMGVGKSNAKVYVEKRTGITFADVAGEDEAKDSLREMVDFLHNPRKYAEIGAKLPKGALLVGPPGTGKTLLAKAVAGEAKVPFFSLSGSDFVEMFVGVGASRVRDLFKQAHSMAPCIIFIDEIDAIGKSRDSKYGGGNDEREQTLNQLLAEMDGFDPKSKGVVILAATNRPDVLDKALLRPGRFDRRVIVDRPDLKGRVAILKVHSKDVLMDDTVDIDAIAMATAGAVGSDLANMINEAAIMAVKAGRKSVSQADLFEAVEVVIAGKEKKDRILGKEEKRIVAFHEVGHALITASMKNADPVQKITIVPRTMGSLGYTMQLPKEEKFLQSKEELETDIITLLGGRAAEDVVFNSITTGASNDIERATAILRSMITQYGMSDRFGMVGLESIENRYLDGRAVLNCADETAAKIDEEVARRMKEFYERAVSIIKENRDVLDKIAEYLIEKETITGKEFIKMYREIKGLPEPDDEKKDKPESKAAENPDTVVEKVETVEEKKDEAVLEVKE
ncbi:cell division protein FtsH family protein [Catonella morbi ATCC 51271]|uniref:ATP-dependent zinc metalloprotease FtsH n=2 Tax=Catonella TaxID=43996 RepID=V2Y4U9_9FIRM|nr:cell division protein FtsH family protein [Catonella morbi ATCC 51271]